MKISIKNIRHIGGVFKKKSKKKEVTLTNPLRDWSIGLILAVVLFISGVLVIVFDFYFQFVSPEIPEVTEKPLIYRENEVREYANLYNEKAKEFKALRNAQVYIPPTAQSTTTEEELLEKEASLTENEEVLEEESLAEEVVDE